MSNTKRDQYINAIAANGHKITRDNVLHAWPVHQHGTSELPVPRGRTIRPSPVWVETGDDTARLEHAKVEHARDFTNIGIHPEKQNERLPQYMEASTTVGRYIGYTTNKRGRPVMFTYFKDEQRVVSNGITVGNNGFVLSGFQCPFLPISVDMSPPGPCACS